MERIHTLKYNIKNGCMASYSATGFIVNALIIKKGLHFGDDFNFKDITLIIEDFPEYITWRGWQAFMDDLNSLEAKGVEIVLMQGEK